MDAKSLFVSKTFWVNAILGTGVFALPLLGVGPIDPMVQSSVSVVSGINILLRLFADGPVVLFKTPA